MCIRDSLFQYGLLHHGVDGAVLRQGNGAGIRAIIGNAIHGIHVFFIIHHGLNLLVDPVSYTHLKLNNPGFLSKAPAQLVEQEREKLKTTASMLEALKARIEDLKQA